LRACNGKFDREQPISIRGKSVFVPPDSHQPPIWSSERLCDQLVESRLTFHDRHAKEIFVNFSNCGRSIYVLQKGYRFVCKEVN
jgi:hypothetical protein